MSGTILTVPEISRFFGIMITMNYNDHNPPHFHARYGFGRSTFNHRTLRRVQPPRVLGLVTEWAVLHRAELNEDWLLARSMKPLKRISPLE